MKCAIALLLLCGMSGASVVMTPAPIVISENVRLTIGRNAPSFRIPTAQDRWDDESLGLWWDGDPTAAPYVALGDFDGDGNTDACFILLHREKGWRISVVEAIETETPRFIEIAQPSRIPGSTEWRYVRVRPLPAGTEWGIEAGDEPSSFSLSRDAVEVAARTGGPDIIKVSKTLLYRDSESAKYVYKEQ